MLTSTPANPPPGLAPQRRSTTTRAVVALALMIGFYLLAAGVVGALLYIAVTAPSYASAALLLKILIVTLGAASAIAWSLRPRRDVFVPPGPEVTRAEQPELFALIDDIATRTGVRGPAVVYVTPDLNAAVLDRGGFFGFGGRRVMLVGLPLLHAETVDHLRAIIAHEFGHFGAGDTKIGRIVYRGRIGIARTIEAMEGRFLVRLFILYGNWMIAITSEVSRQQELEADRFAARATSTDDMSASLEATERLGFGFGFYMAQCVTPALDKGRRPPICAGFLEFMKRPSVVEHTVGISQFLSRFRDDADSHPPLAERVASLNLERYERVTTPDTRPAVAIVRAPDRLETDTFKTSSGDSIRSLTPMAWAEYLELERVPFWRQHVKENLKFLGGFDVDRIPDSSNARLELDGRKPLGDSEWNEELMAREIQLGVALHSAICLHLFELGWKASEEPSDRVQFHQGDLVANPYAMINRSPESTDERWADFCARAGLSGKLVRGTPVASGPRAGTAAARSVDAIIAAFRDSKG